MRSDKALPLLLQKRLQQLGDALVERPKPNQCAALLPLGPRAYPMLLRALGHPAPELRMDALITLGQLFATHGPNGEALDAVVQYAKRLKQPGITAERQCVLFAIGRSGHASLINSFMPLLQAAAPPHATTTACYVLGYARWHAALPDLEPWISQGHGLITDAAIWAVGEMGQFSSLAVLRPLLARWERVEGVLAAMIAIGNPDMMHDIAPLLGSSATEHRHVACMTVWQWVSRHSPKEALRDLSGTHIIPRLYDLLKDPHDRTATYAMLSLANLGLPVDVACVERILKLPSSATRASHP